ncbi:MAG: NAD kinase [Betaproteobacteria bacterium]|nr:NAD kinase [Betaproteobacteria bacterium]
MLASFKTAALVGRPQTAGLEATLQAISGFLAERGVHCLIEHAVWESCVALQHLRSASFDDIGRHADLVIAVGGDGTLLGAARQIGASETPLVGINHGRVGFVTDMTLSGWRESLARVLAGEYRIERRAMISATVSRRGHPVWSTLAVNDIVVTRSSRAGMIGLEVEVDDQHMYSQRADGLIVATPTGSTAYALSVNGPILHPQLAGLVLAPIAPQSLSNRPICLPADVRIRIRVVEGREPRVSGDMQVFGDLHIDDDIRIQCAPHAMCLVHPPGYRYFESLRSKLNWHELPVHEHSPR